MFIFRVFGYTMYDTSHFLPYRISVVWPSSDQAHGYPSTDDNRLCARIRKQSPNTAKIIPWIVQDNNRPVLGKNPDLRDCLVLMKLLLELTLNVTV